MDPNKKFATDAEQKEAARRGGRASKPGVVGVSGNEADELDRRIAEKRGGNSTSGNTPRELNQLEQDLAAKQKGRPQVQTASPGAFTANAPTTTARSELSSLEADVAAKQRARAPGVTAAPASLDRKVAAKVRDSQRPSGRASEALNSLEAAVQAKMRREGGGGASSGHEPGARESLENLEQQITAKQSSMGDTARSELSQLDERIAAKNASVGPPANAPTPRSLQQAEESILEKKGVTSQGVNVVPSKDDKEEDFLKDDGLGGLDGPNGAEPDLLQQNPDLEYGEYGGPDEEGLAVAVQIEEDDEDMFIPSAVEYDPDAKPPIYKNRRFRLYASLAMAAALVGIVGAAIGITASASDGPPEVAYRETLGIRENIERVVPKETLDDLSSPYRKALQWITHDDSVQMTIDHKRFYQRYFAAYFYFATTTKRPWNNGCDRAMEDETDNCMYIERSGVDFPQYSEIAWRRWLGSTSECQWAGIGCDEEEQIRSIDLSGTNMTGTFPEGIKNLPYLQFLGMNFGELEGTLPDSIAEMKHLVEIDIQGHLFTGSIPDSWFSSKSLQAIDASVNLLSGTISTKIGEMTDLKAFYVERNQMQGSIPSEIGNLHSLTYTRFSRNSFNGTIPTTIGSMTNTYLLWFQGNRLSGNIPSEIGQAINLEDIQFSDNLLSGSIPDQLYDLRKLLRADLENNKLTGTLSSRVANMVALQQLLLHENLMGGAIPSEMAAIPYLKYLSFEGNSFVGSVPIELCPLERSDIGLDRLFGISADCKEISGVSEIECDCCTLCCDENGDNCLET